MISGTEQFEINYIILHIALSQYIVETIILSLILDDR